MAGIQSALALAGSPANLLAGKSGTILVYQEDRIPPDIIRLEPPVLTEEADGLAVKIEEGEAYAVLGIVSTDVVPQEAGQSRWFIRR